MIRLILTSLVLVVLSGCTEQQKPSLSPAGETTFVFIDGNKKNLDDYTGQWLLVNFWSVTCPPCFQEMPELSRLYRELRPDNFSLVGVAMPYDRPDMVLETQKVKQLPYPIAIDIQGKVNRAFGIVQLVPSSYLLNPDGDVVKQYAGVVTHETLKKELAYQQSEYNKRK